jgi:hypothetical protein
MVSMGSELGRNSKFRPEFHRLPFPINGFPLDWSSFPVLRQNFKTSESVYGIISRALGFFDGLTFY